MCFCVLILRKNYSFFGHICTTFIKNAPTGHDNILLNSLKILPQIIRNKQQFRSFTVNNLRIFAIFPRGSQNPVFLRRMVQKTIKFIFISKRFNSFSTIFC